MLAKTVYDVAAYGPFAVNATDTAPLSYALFVPTSVAEFRVGV